MKKIEALIHWFSQRKGRVTYSQAARLGPDSYDCSSAVYFALIAAGMLPKGNRIGNTDTLYGDLAAYGWYPLTPTAGHYHVQRGDIFIWGEPGASGGHAGHTGVFLDANDQMIHCTCGWDGQRCLVNTITIDDHDTIWRASGKPKVTIYRYPSAASWSPEVGDTGSLVAKKGCFIPAISLPVSPDTDPQSPALAYYPPGAKIYYDHYLAANGYIWISYLAISGKRRYLAIGPDDGQVATVWGQGF